MYTPLEMFKGHIPTVYRVTCKLFYSAGSMNSVVTKTDHELSIVQTIFEHTISIVIRRVHAGAFTCSYMCIL